MDDVAAQLARASEAELIDPGAPDDGLYVLRLAPRSLLARVTETHLVVALDGPLALDLDLPALLERTDFLPGSIAAVLDLELPFWTEWLERGGRSLERRFPAQPPVGDLLSALARDVLANSSRLQLALQGDSHDLLFSARLTPRAGSTLKGLARVQLQEMPGLLRHVEREDGVTGADADDRFRALVDRIAAPYDPSASVAAPFDPLRLGPGVFVRLDPRSIAGGSPSPLDGLSPEDSRVLLGMRFDEQALDVNIVVPLALIDRVGRRTPPLTPGSAP